MIEDALVERLTTDDDVLEIIGGPYNRIWPKEIPQHSEGEPDKIPCIVYRRVSDDSGQTFCAVDDLVSGTFQIDSYGYSYEKARELARLVKLRLNNFRGLLAGIRVGPIFYVTSFDISDPDPGLHRVSQTYSVWYKE